VRSTTERVFRIKKFIINILLIINLYCEFLLRTTALTWALS